MYADGRNIVPIFGYLRKCRIRVSCFWEHHDWLVVSIPLKNIGQLGWFFPIYGKIKNVPNHQPIYIYNILHYIPWILSLYIPIKLRFWRLYSIISPYLWHYIQHHAALKSHCFPFIINHIAMKITIPLIATSPING